MNPREEIDQVMRDGESEENNVAVDTFSPQRKKSEKSDYLINKAAKLTTKNIGNDIINEVTNLKINDVGNDSNEATMSDTQVQFTVDPDRISHQNLLSGHMTGIRQEEVPVLVQPTEMSIAAKNKADMTISTGVIHTRQVLKTPTMKEFIMDTTPYRTGAKSTPKIMIRTGIDGSTPDVSGNVISAVDICPSTTPTYVCIWNGSIGNIGKTVTGTKPSFRDTSELHTYIGGILTNNSNFLSVGSQIICDELSVSSGKNIYLRCRMDVTAETVHPMGTQLVSHGLTTIDTLNENARIWSPVTSAIIRTPNNTHVSVSRHVLRQGIVVG